MTTKKESNALTDKVALVTGAARRVGAQIADSLHRQGMRVIMHCCHSCDKAQSIASNLNARRAESAVVLKGDLLQISDLQQLADRVISQWGRLDVLVNNASLFFPTSVNEVTQEQWDELINIHTKAPFFLAQALSAELSRREGSIVNITDIHGDRPLKGYSVYSIAKAGLAMLTKVLARELAPKVRCNAIAPGAILWPEKSHYESQHQAIIEQTALKRQGHPEDIAQAVIYLIRDAGYVTGQTIVVDGGRTLSN